jgi:hypothetical protein
MSLDFFITVESDFSSGLVELVMYAVMGGIRYYNAYVGYLIYFCHCALLSVANTNLRNDRWLVNVEEKGTNL